MSAEYKEVVARLREQYQQIISLYLSSLKMVEKLKNEKNELHLELEDRKNKIIELERKANTLEMAGSLVSNENSSEAAKQKVSKIVREIDKCIALLNK